MLCQSTLPSQTLTPHQGHRHSEIAISTSRPLQLGHRGGSLRVELDFESAYDISDVILRGCRCIRRGGYQHW